MSNLPVWAVGYALRTAGVPCAEEIAMMLCRKKSEPEVSFTDAAYHVFDGTVLATPSWDAEAEPYAFVYADGESYVLCTSAEPFTLEKKNILTYQVRAAAAYRQSVYDRTSNTWGEFDQQDVETVISASYNEIMWTNRELRPEGLTVDVVTPYSPRAFAFNEQNRATAFLYTDGYIYFQSNSIPSKNIDYSAVFADWDTVQYTTSARVPWLRLDADRTGIVRAIINDDAIPVYTDRMFYNCENLTHATLPDEIESIGYGMFYKTKIINPPIPAKAISIGDYAFAYRILAGNWQSLDNNTLTIPSTVKYIGNRAFYEFNGDLHYLNVAAEHIGSYAFGNAVNLRSATIGSSVKRIDTKAFDHCGHGEVTAFESEETANITFENTEGWWISTSASAISGTAIDVTDPVQNGKNLGGWCSWNGSYVSPSYTVHQGVYESYYWNRGE